MPTALLAVYHKKGVEVVAQRLAAMGYDLIASRGTADWIREQVEGLKVRDVSEFTGLEPILNHKVVTLTPQIHGGLLTDRNDAEEMAELEEKLGTPPIDFVFVDLYPLEEAIASEGATLESVREKTDIGGPTMLRSAAKGDRIVVGSYEDIGRVLDWMEGGMPPADEMKRHLQARAEFICADYILDSARYLGNREYEGFTGILFCEGFKAENGHQGTAALYALPGNNDPLALHKFVQLSGDPASYVGLTDIDRLLQTITHAAAAYEVNIGSVPLIAIAVKHGNPCGMAVGDDPERVLRDTVAGNPRAIFGGTVMTNFPLDGDLATIIRHFLVPGGGRRPMDGVIAPSVDERVIDEMERQDARGRVYVNPTLANLGVHSLDRAPRFRQVRGCSLRQENYLYVLNLELFKMHGREPTTLEQHDLLLAWAVCHTSNSNTITIAREGMLVANAVGQQDRVGASELAIKLANENGHDLHGAVACSDSFFPFPDGALVLADAGISVICATEGGKNYQDVVKALAGRGVAFCTVPDNEGRGFHNH